MKPVDLDFSDDEPTAPKRAAFAPEEVRFEDLPPTPSTQLVTRSEPKQPTALLLRSDIPHSQEAEEYLISSCLIDGEYVMNLCVGADLTAPCFFSPANQIIFSKLLDLYLRQVPIDTSILAEELKKNGQLNAIGGFAYIAQVSSRIPTTAQAPYFVDRVRGLHDMRQLILSTARITEDGFTYDGEFDEFAQRALAAVELATGGARKLRLEGRDLMDFKLPPPGHESILIGDRWLSRGDGAIIASTSGMGKSSLSLQMAICWALGMGIFGGFKPNGELKSLIFQSEDSEGDIAEVVLSLIHAMKLTTEQILKVKQNVIIVTDRVHRGATFRAELKRQLAIHKPDIVWINPLLAFIGGDINDAEAAGLFLREQLNSLNEPPQFAYIIIHHTAKPPKEKVDRKWSEMMYDMAGSADLTNWARAILSLRSADNPGEFNLHLAKRGARAGITTRVKGNINPQIKFDQPATMVGIRHSTERIDVNGTSMGLIYWEMMDRPAEDAPAKSSGAGRPRTTQFSDFAVIFPVGIENGIHFRAIHRMAREIRPTVGTSSMMAIIDQALLTGELFVDKSNPKQPKYYVSGNKQTVEK